MGTWKAEYEYGQHMVHDEDGRLVMATRNRRVALLVAAAPKLLAACEGMLKHIDDVLEDEDLMSRRATLMAAIREAKGGGE